MTGLLTSAFLAVLLGWAGFAIAGFLVPPAVAAGIGLVLGGGVAAAFRASIAWRGLVAILEPVGVILPLLALRHMAQAAGWPIPAFSTPEIAGFLVFHLLFMVAAFGLVPINPYRLGYAPWPVAVMVLGLCGYGLATGNPFLPLAAVLAQALWVARLGSSNWFDHILHATLTPMAIFALAVRLI